MNPLVKTQISNRDHTERCRKWEDFLTPEWPPFKNTSGWKLDEIFRLLGDWERCCWPSVYATLPGCVRWGVFSDLMSSAWHRACLSCCRSWCASDQMPDVLERHHHADHERYPKLYLKEPVYEWHQMRGSESLLQTLHSYLMKPVGHMQRKHGLDTPKSSYRFQLPFRMRAFTCFPCGCTTLQSLQKPTIMLIVTMSKSCSVRNEADSKTSHISHISSIYFISFHISNVESHHQQLWPVCRLEAEDIPHAIQMPTQPTAGLPHTQHSQLRPGYTGFRGTTSLICKSNCMAPVP
ncbi:hypothetical protein SELMODRAFT_409173 [Selaginella moellendorffii]|uniref:Uncharacterized protein n=1 Tax=Selaginella moellendorffii TaxID=88036 RepID=D8RAL3_SELML|nr:hypothetical protein SELMODRAFT_409173 [Selaginella moellendorffii]